MKGRRAVVTGGNTGIGKAACERLAQEGASVCVNYYAPQEADATEAFVQQLIDGGAPQAIAVQADVGSEPDVQRLMSRACDDLGGLALLVNNAGIEKRVALLEMSLHDWDAVLRTNLTGAFLCLREAGRRMVDH